MVEIELEQPVELAAVEIVAVAEAELAAENSACFDFAQIAALLVCSLFENLEQA